MSTYAVYNKDCGHVLGVHNDRDAYERIVDHLRTKGLFSVRTRVATDEDIAAVQRGDRCESCSFEMTAGVAR